MDDNDQDSVESYVVPDNDGAESSNEADSTTTGASAAGKNGADKSKEDEEFAQRETRAVFRLRLLVVLVLLLAAVAVSVIVYFITSGAEVQEFETQYKGSATKVVEVFDNIVAEKFGAISALGVAIIAHGVDHKRTWPFVTLSSFQQRASTARAQSGAVLVNICPLVSEDDRAEWEQFVVGEDSYWIDQAYDYQAELDLTRFEYINNNGSYLQGTNSTPPSDIWTYAGASDEEDVLVVRDPGPGPYLPIWQSSPVTHPNFVNFNRFHTFPEMSMCMENGEAVLAEMMIDPPSNAFTKQGRDQVRQGDSSAGSIVNGTLVRRFDRGDYFASLLSFAEKKPVNYNGDPMTYVVIPIFDSFNVTRRTVAVMTVAFNWGNYFRSILPTNMHGVHVVLKNSCNQTYTYQIDGETVVPLGEGDLHEPHYDYLEYSTTLSSERAIEDGTLGGLKLSDAGCHYEIAVYPSSQLENKHHTSTPVLITFVVAIIFVFTAFMFFVYDRLVERRQRLVLRKATQSTAIVSSLFPENVRDRLLQSNDDCHQNLMAPNSRLKSYLKTGDTTGGKTNAPIADLFPNATVMFADIAGFTAWSSTRDPAQVFILLQTVYQNFDALAKRRNVFKVETIGDSYVAVTGCPEPQANHAVIMARYAHECLTKMAEVVRSLEVTLGPDTGDLTMRFGLHSGPVTAGVLKGDRARFQLFGDTVNTAARMESTGTRNKIQISQATADLLSAAGKGHWIKRREDEVQAKGKGVMSTYWLTPRAKGRNPSDSGSSDVDVASSQGSEDGTKRVDDTIVLKKDRLVDWVTDVLQEHLKKVVAMRCPTSFAQRNSDLVPNVGRNASATALDEVAEAITLPKFDAKAVAKLADWEGIELDSTVLRQLREYVSIIASTYRENSFHNFEHACHVTMAVNKFLKRIVAPDLEFNEHSAPANKKSSKHALASKIHDYTHGLTSDPLTQLGIVFSALIHDADHRGVSNAQLIVEQPQLAQLYRNKSVAEQNSLDISWDLLLSDQFRDLRACMFATSIDVQRFRQVLVNVVLATDIFDKELNELRKKRWEKAFAVDGANSSTGDADLRATIVIEHIIQASDVSHTMQHWHIYRKWNERLFKEMYAAYTAGRMATDPATFWYKGELAFFDNYIIPLAKKLKDCNVFGVSSDECLNYAMKNRAEWQERGVWCVEEMMADVESMELLGSSTEPEHSPLNSS